MQYLLTKRLLYEDERHRDSSRIAAVSKSKKPLEATSRNKRGNSISRSLEFFLEHKFQYNSRPSSVTRCYLFKYLHAHFSMLNSSRVLKSFFHESFTNLITLEDEPLSNGTQESPMIFLICFNNRDTSRAAN